MSASSKYEPRPMMLGVTSITTTRLQLESVSKTKIMTSLTHADVDADADRTHWHCTRHHRRRSDRQSLYRLPMEMKPNLRSPSVLYRMRRGTTSRESTHNRGESARGARVPRALGSYLPIVDIPYSNTAQLNSNPNPTTGRWTVPRDHAVQKNPDFSF
jgi:hypothetical protein